MNSLFQYYLNSLFTKAIMNSFFTSNKKSCTQHFYIIWHWEKLNCDFIKMIPQCWLYESAISGADLGFREGGVGVEIDARAKRAPENFG